MSGSNPINLQAFKAAEIFDVSGSVVFVTGAASGLGLSIAEVMAANGARVMMADIDAAALDDAHQRLREAGLEVEKTVLDVADSVAVRRAIDRTVDMWGRLDAAFANAGISAGPGPFISETGEIQNVQLNVWKRVLDVNLTGVFATMQAAAAHMKKQAYGRIVVTASAAGVKSECNVGYAYAATKAAVINLVRQAAVELAPYKICVNGMAPGTILTNIAGGKMRDPELAKPYLVRVPQKRQAHADEIKGLALLLGSRASSFITGATIVIDGGLTA